MSITCPECGYDRNPPNAVNCELCESSLSGANSQSPTVENNLPRQTPQHTTSTTDTEIQPPKPQYSEPPPTINIQPPKPQYSEPPPTINIQPPKPQYSEPPPTINIQPTMNITCHNCGYDRNLPSAEFCDVCGSELSPPPVEVLPTSEPTKLQEPLTNIHPSYPQTPAPVQIPEIQPNPVSTTAKLITKLVDAPNSEFLLEDSNIIGRFDPDTGPVEIDLEGFAGANYISRHHAEIYWEGGLWKIKDLGSENGVFLKRLGENRFSPRITAPETLNPGDEVAFAKIRFVFQSF